MKRLPRAWALVVLALDATERCVPIRVVRLKPITERPPQHARRCAGRTAFHHIVLAIEEIRRISGIKGHRRETGKRFEFGARPFPAVTDQVMDSISACAARIGTYRAGIPMREIKIS